MLLDQFYTPTEVAEDLLSNVMNISNISSCLDTSCGSGRLLDAADKTFPKANCIGIDKDKKNIKLLKKQKPNWTLSSADILLPNSYNRTLVVSETKTCDLLVLNPPFSMNKTKFQHVEYAGEEIKSSVAMAHILKSFELFKPKHGAVIIVPESVLYSEIDSHARSLLSSQYSISTIVELHETTFLGTRAHSVGIRVAPKSISISSRPAPALNTKRPKVVRTKLSRGGLQVHGLHKSLIGAPFLHTKNLKKVTTNPESLKDLPKTNQVMSGRINGWAILIPRVGIPSRDNIKPLYFSEEIQLSDCLLALSCNDENSTTALASRITDNWLDFISLYKGTGARYTTLKRLIEWLQRYNVIADKL